MIIDIHAHAFPDQLAPRAMAALQAEVASGITAYLDGTTGALLRSMATAGVDVSVVASIATKPTQFAPILAWSRTIASAQLLPFPSLHPDDPDLVAHVDELAAAGFKGIKLHPYYQRFKVDEERVFPLYDRLQHHGLVLLCHTGFDIAYPRERVADPVRIARVVKAFPRLAFIATHLGAWEDWDEVTRHLLGQPIYFDVAFVYAYLGAARMREMILAHPADRVLFATDSPWDDQALALARIRELQLGDELEARILGGNARQLLCL